jgi:hypothetical protein
MWGLLRKVSAPRMFFCIGPMVICTCGLLPNPAKVPNFQYRAWLYSMDQKFHGDDEITQESWFWDLAQWPTAIIRPKSQNSNIKHDGILSIGNFMQMINNHFARFQPPGNLLKTKKCAPYFRGNTQFPIYFWICWRLWPGIANEERTVVGLESILSYSANLIFRFWVFFAYFISNL